MRVLLFFGGAPAGLSNEVRLHFVVQAAEVALQHKHELLKAICGRWHSPLSSQPRRYQQMVGVKMLNIKQPPFISTPQVSPPLQALFSAFWSFCLYLEANKRQLPAKCLKRFSECWVFLDICCFLVVCFSFLSCERSLQFKLSFTL